MLKFKQIITQFFKFIGISGIGWLIDFSIFTALTSLLAFNVFTANCISAVPAITLVFIVSTRKIFTTGTKMPLWVKYVLYLVYQAILLVGISFVGQKIDNVLVGILPVVLCAYSKIASKIIITPITMVVNFVVMKVLAEKV